MIETAVIAAAGKGTRLLPFSSAVPKELVPIICAPVIQYVVQELADSGVKRLIVVTDPEKVAIREFLDRQAIEEKLREIKPGPSRDRLSELLELLSKLDIVFANQGGKYGNGTPLVSAAPYIEEDAFYYTWADDFIAAIPTRFTQLREVYEQYHSPVLSGVKAQTEDDYRRYAYVEATHVQSNIHRLQKIVEKPEPRDAPSDLGVLSGHLFTRSLLSHLEPAYQSHSEGEFLFNHVVHTMIDAGESVHVCEIQNGQYFDTGNPLSYSKTFLWHALNDPAQFNELRSYLSSVLD